MRPGLIFPVHAQRSRLVDSGTGSYIESCHAGAGNGAPQIQHWFFLDDWRQPVGRSVARCALGWRRDRGAKSDIQQLAIHNFALSQSKLRGRAVQLFDIGHGKDLMMQATTRCSFSDWLPHRLCLAITSTPKNLLDLAVTEPFLRDCDNP